MLDVQCGTDRAHADFFVSEVIFSKRFLTGEPVDGLKMLIKIIFNQ